MPAPVTLHGRPRRRRTSLMWCCKARAQLRHSKRLGSQQATDTHPLLVSTTGEEAGEGCDVWEEAGVGPRETCDLLPHPTCARRPTILLNEQLLATYLEIHCIHFVWLFVLSCAYAVRFQSNFIVLNSRPGAVAEMPGAAWNEIKVFVKRPQEYLQEESMQLSGAAWPKILLYPGGYPKHLSGGQKSKSGLPTEK